MQAPKNSIDWSWVNPSLVIAEPDSVKWDFSADVVVVGFGGAGVCAAIEAKDYGASVIAIDRFDGGGATALSGGVLYYGGGTPYQREGDVEDTPQEMFKYLKLEVGDAVSDETLKRFCEGSSDDLAWLARHGLLFNGRLDASRASFPAAGHYLYYSGNERAPSYAALARPAARGHVTYDPNQVGGMRGNVFYAGLRQTALKSGVRLLAHSPAIRLFVDSQGTVIGVEIAELPEGGKARMAHQSIIDTFNRVTRLRNQKVAQRAIEKCLAIEQRHGVKRLVRAKSGIVLSTGGFAYNRRMMQRFAPRYVDLHPFGTMGCDGSGMGLGHSAGGSLGRMDKVSAFRIITPPRPFVKGLIVNTNAERFCSEDIYAAMLGHLIGERQNGTAWLILDRKLFRAALKECFSSGFKSFVMLYLPALLGMFLGSKKDGTIAKLAQRCGMDPERLATSIEQYNLTATGIAKDPHEKLPENRAVLDTPPYYALDISLVNKHFPCPYIPVGGLVVDEATGSVKRDDGTSIPGLYAAGRTAVGLVSNFYVGGLSISDCVFSGRRAGNQAACRLPRPDH